jgi:hypothetical protein
MTARALTGCIFRQWRPRRTPLNGSFEATDALLVIDDFAPQGSQRDINRLHATADRDP